MKPAKPKTAFLFFALTVVLFCGCKSSRHTRRPTPVKRPSADLSISGLTLKGAVITRISAGAIYYQKRCAACGFLSPEDGSIPFSHAPGKEESTFVCPKCGKATDVLIQRAR